MHDFNRILIPLDGSQTAEQVFPQVSRLMHRVDACVVLLRAVSVPQIAAVDRIVAIAELRREAEAYLAGVAKLLVGQGICVETVVSVGNPDDVILDVAGQKKVGLIAMSTHGRTGLAHLVHGSVTEKVLYSTSRVPLLVVRSFGSGGAPRSPLPFANILIPFDGTAECLSIVPWVASLATLFGSRVTFLSVVDEDDTVEGRETMLARLDTAADQLAERGVPVIMLQRRGVPVDEILETCTQHSIDLIAMSSHHRMGFGSGLMESVSESVMRASTIPVLIHRGQVGKPAVAAS